MGCDSLGYEISKCFAKFYLEVTYDVTRSGHRPVFILLFVIAGFAGRISRFRWETKPMKWHVSYLGYLQVLSSALEDLMTGQGLPILRDQKGQNVAFVFGWCSTCF